MKAKSYKGMSHTSKHSHHDSSKHEGSMGKERRMSHEGYKTGDMTPVVEDYQRNDKSFSQSGFSRVTDYIERQDRIQDVAAGDIRKQSYEGRYS